LLLLPAVCALFGSWFVVRWYVGNTMAEYASSGDERAVEMARVATRWAPGDPFTHWRLASLEDKVFSLNGLADAVREYQLAVTLSPNDYRYWMELGRALESSGDIAGGEKALRRAVDLAPAYSHPRWHYGNLLVRVGKMDEGFVQLARAAGADEAMGPPVFNLAWQIFGGDVDQIARVACPSLPVRMQFAIYLVKQARFADAIRIWRTINPAERKDVRAFNEEFLNALLSARQFRAALKVMREVEPDVNKPAPEQFWNGGFESDLAQGASNIFSWTIDSKSQARMGIDTKARSGHGSLRIVFNAPTKLDAIPLSQTVVVEPGTHYQIEFYVRTEDLTSGAAPFISIFDATTNIGLASSLPASTGTNDWQRMTLDFKTSPTCDGVILKVSRGSCEKEQVCPIFGTIWYDDFSLQRVRGPGSAPGVATREKR